jgi:hypothetical protein
MVYFKENNSSTETTIPNSPSTRLQPESTHQFMELGNEMVSKDDSTALDSDIPNIVHDDVIDNDHGLITSNINNPSPKNPLTANDLHVCVTPTEEEDFEEFGNFDSDEDGFGSFDDDPEFGSFDEGDFNTVVEPVQKETIDVSFFFTGKNASG